MTDYGASGQARHQEKRISIAAAGDRRGDDACNIYPWWKKRLRLPRRRDQQGATTRRTHALSDTGGRMVRNHVMITLTLFGSGETALDHGSRFESDGGRAAIGRSAPGQSVSVRPRRRGSIAGGLVPRTDQNFFIFSFQLVQGGAKGFLPSQRWTAVARRSGYGSRG